MKPQSFICALLVCASLSQMEAFGQSCPKIQNVEYQTVSRQDHKNGQPEFLPQNPPKVEVYKNVAGSLECHREYLVHYNSEGGYCLTNIDSVQWEESRDWMITYNDDYTSSSTGHPSPNPTVHLWGQYAHTIPAYEPPVADFSHTNEFNYGDTVEDGYATLVPFTYPTVLPTKTATSWVGSFSTNQSLEIYCLCAGGCFHSEWGLGWPGYSDWDYSITTNLSTPYSTSELISVCQNNLGKIDFDDGEGWNIAGVTEPVVAGYSISDSETNMTLTKGRYRLHYQGDAGTTSVLRWYEVFNGIRSVKEEQVTCSGEVDETQIHYVDAPDEEGEVTLELPDDSSCACSEGDPEAKLTSINFSIDLGRNTDGKAAGRLYIYAKTPNASLCSLTSLQGTFGRNIEPFYWSGKFNSVMTPEYYVYAANETSTSYELVVLENAGPVYANWKIENPDTSGATYNRLNIIKLYPITVTNSYIWSDANQNWELVSGNGLRDETKVTTTDPSTGDEIVTDTIRDQQQKVVRVEQSRFHTYADPLGRALVAFTTDPQGVNRTTTYSYYTDVTDTNYGKLEMVVPATGVWTHYVYGTDGALRKEISGFGNVAPSLTADESQCRVTSYDYTPIDVSDDGALDPQTPRTTIVTLLGHAISTNYAIIAPGKRTSIQSQGGSLSNLVTVTQDVTTGNPWAIGRTKQIDFPDDTRETDWYDFSTADGNGNFFVTNTVFRGAADPANSTNVIGGTETITVMRDTGRVLSTIVFDIESTIKTSRQINQLDELGRAVRSDYLDGTHTGYSYACCGVDAVTNRDGSVVTYEYDALKRRFAQHSYVNASDTISVLTGYDPVGNVLSTTRIGTNGSSILQSSATYDFAGQVTSTRDALNNPTQYTNYVDTSGQSTKMTTYPDNSTRIETYFLDGSLKSVTGTAVHGMRYEYGVEQDGNAYRSYTKEIKLNADGGDTSEWTKTYTDAMGRAYKTVFPDGAANQSVYNNRGQLTNQVDADGVSTLYAYNAKGEQTVRVVDMDRNGKIDFAGSDRIMMVTNDVTADNGTDVNRTRTFVWKTSADAPTLASTVETSVEGLQSWNIIWDGGVGVTNWSVTAYDGNGDRFVTNTALDGSYSISIYQCGRLISVTSWDSLSNQLSAVSYGYDAHGRQTTATDARNGTSTSFYNYADQISGTLTPSANGIQSGQVTTNYFDNMGRIWMTTLPDNTSVTNEFYSTGELKKAYGSRTYPVAYAYDYAGRMQTMTTWQNFAGNSGAAVTTWNYDPQRGFLTGKTYDGPSAGPSYAYTAAGRVKTRTWARGTVTTYGYDNAGDLYSVVYSDGTSGITNGFDRLGRKISVTNGGSVCALVYNDSGELLSESYSGGPLDGLTVTNTFDSLLRRTNLTLNSQLTTLSSTAYSYDAASRLQTVSDGTNSATYSYVVNSRLVDQITFRSNSFTAMTTTKSYDYLNRLTSIQSSANGSPVASFSYGNNSANQCISVTNADGSYWVYEYDDLGQVKSGKKYWSDGTPVAGQQFEYGFDDIGNRTTTKTGGDATGANLRPANYSLNSLNQYSQRDVPGYLEIQGSANSNATVTVNGQSTYRRGEYFQAELATNNGASALWVGITNVATLPTLGGTNYNHTNSGSVFLAQTNEQFSYDADGNLTSDGRFAYFWDGENRLTNLTSLSTTPDAAKLKLDFIYDYQFRRIQKVVSTWDGSEYVAQSSSRFVHDGWNLIAILDPQSSILQSFMWGNDMSGSMQGAGGVGGLLAMDSYGTSTTNCFVSCDGNGNVAGLVSVADGTRLATYQYGPFGELLRASGPMAKSNPIRFSTKYQDETDLLYYGYRYHNSSTGRWLSRDRVEEMGGINLYASEDNDPIGKIDALGLDPLAEMSPGKYGAQNFVVHKCAVVIVLGHASSSHPHRFVFDKGHESCSGAGVTGCYSAMSNSKIPDAAKIPGTPNYNDEVSTDDPEYKQGVENIRNGALAKAAQICKNPEHCCEKVWIYYFDAPKNDALEDTLYQHKKPMIETYDCKTGRIINTENNYFLDDRTKK